LLEEHFNVKGLIVEEDLQDLIGCFVDVDVLVRGKLPLEVCKEVLHCTEFWGMGRGKDHLQAVPLHNLHYVSVLMGEEVIMLENKRLIGVLRLQSLHQVLEVIDVSLVFLAAVVKELHLLTAMSTDTDRACEVLPEELLPPLESEQQDEKDYLNSLPLLGIAVVFG